MNWELIGKLGGGTDIQIHPVEVDYPRYGYHEDREVLKVHGEPGSQYLITIEGHYENSYNMDSYQLRWRTESSDWVRISENARGGRTQVAVLAQAGDTLTVGRQHSDRQQDVSFVGKAYISPVPEISEEEGDTTTFPVGPMPVVGRNYTEHLLADLEVPPGEVWKVKVTGIFTWNTNNMFIDITYRPTIMIGSKQSDPAEANKNVELESYVSTMSRVSLIANYKDEVEFEGTVEITPMKW